MFRNSIHWQSPLLDDLILTGIGTVLLCWLSPQVWMFQGDLPITPQSLMVVLWGVLWGWKVGTLSVVLTSLQAAWVHPYSRKVHLDGITSREALPDF